MLCRINDTITLLREKLPETHLLMLGILPRGDGTNSSTTYRWPGIYTPAISSVNDWLIEVSEKEEKISYLDCGPMLLYNGQVKPKISGRKFEPHPCMNEYFLVERLPTNCQNALEGKAECHQLKALPGRGSVLITSCIFLADYSCLSSGWASPKPCWHAEHGKMYFSNAG